MKNITLALALIFSFAVFAQEKAVEPKFEKDGKMVKATYYHENGEIAQIGHYLNGKLQGEWISYDVTGEKIAIANYDEGKKTGKWFFWNDETLKEVDYTDNRIANVTVWNNDNPIVKNK